MDQSYRGQGIGYKIVSYLIDLATKNGTVSINLIATELGAPVYKKAGFREVGSYQFLKRERLWSQQSLPDQLKPSSPAFYEQIHKLDQEINGENRGELIGNHPTKNLGISNYTIIRVSDKFLVTIDKKTIRTKKGF